MIHRLMAQKGMGSSNGDVRILEVAVRGEVVFAVAVVVAVAAISSWISRR